MKAAHVIVCRAGATTLAEITAAGRAAVLVPLPTATDDHQRKNAEVLARAGAAEVIDQRELSGARFAAAVLALARDPARRDRMAAAARGLARPGAARVIVDHALAACWACVARCRRRGVARARAHEGDPLRRRRRERPQRHCRGAAAPRVRGERLGHAALAGDGAAGSDSGSRFTPVHDASHVGAVDVVVISSAVRAGNAEVAEARRRGIPVILRADMLAEIMRARFSIAVGGAHGKTTTSSMIAVMLAHAGFDPTAIIGARVPAFGSNARVGKSDYLVAEADESDRSFLRLMASMTVVTNIDNEHLERYDGFADLMEAFVAFASKAPFYGAAVLCADDAHVRAMAPRVTSPIVTYGIDRPDANVGVQDVQTSLEGSSRDRRQTACRQ